MSAAGPAGAASGAPAASPGMAAMGSAPRPSRPVPSRPVPPLVPRLPGLRGGRGLCRSPGWLAGAGGQPDDALVRGKRCAGHRELSGAVFGPERSRSAALNWCHCRRGAEYSLSLAVLEAKCCGFSFIFPAMLTAGCIAQSAMEVGLGFLVVLTLERRVVRGCRP